MRWPLNAFLRHASRSTKGTAPAFIPRPRPTFAALDYQRPFATTTTQSLAVQSHLTSSTPFKRRKTHHQDCPPAVTIVRRPVQDMTVPEIQLDPTEQRFVHLLEECCRWINTTHPQPNAAQGGSQVDYPSDEQDSMFVTARLAGGWVRDTLLGMNSDDMDVSLSGMTGYNFALLFQDYLEHHQSNDTLTAEAASAMSRIAKISANPEQSKNLETATANIFGMSIDFVNLRKEVYQGDSRIPTMVFGTPQEDAERRDICFNSLFYNVHTKRIEDFTKRGLKDLQNGIVRTPLPPLTTFLDDPLRVFRCVRFASRFNYTLHEDIVACLTGHHTKNHNDLSAHSDALHPSEVIRDDPRIKDIPTNEILPQGRQMIREALLKKVSRERVGIEVTKMMGGPYPLLAQALLHKLDLYSLVFYPEVLSDSQPSLRSATSHATLEPISASEMASHALKAGYLIDILSTQPKSSDLTVQIDIPSLSDEQNVSKLTTRAQKIPAELRNVLDSSSGEVRKLLNFVAALLWSRDVEVTGKKGKWTWTGEAVLMQQLKLSRDLTTAVHSILQSASIFTNPQRLKTQKVTQENSYVQNLPHGIDIPYAVHLALLLRDKRVQNPHLNLTWQIALTASLLNDIINSDLDSLSTIISEYSSIVNDILSLNLATISQSTPLLDGKELLSILDLKPGKVLQPIQTCLLIWQFDQQIEKKEPSKDDAAEYLKNVWLQGLIVPFDEREKLMGKAKGGKNR